MLLKKWCLFMSYKFNKIIFLLDSPLDKRYYNFLGVETLTQNGFDVEIWDLTPFFHEDLIDKIILDGQVIFDNYKEFNTKNDIETALSTIPPNTIVNSIISFELKTFFIYRLLSKYKIKYCVLQMISIPPPPSKKTTNGYIRSLINKITSLSVAHIFIGLCNKILLRYYFVFNICPADLALLSGERSLEIVRDPISVKTHKIWAHLWDYDIYLREKNISVIQEPTLGVFLDEYFPLHTDLDYLEISSPIGADEYYSKLCTFFDYLESHYHVRIVIAAHPRSNYSKATDYFGGRMIIKGETAHLVHKSTFVIAHDSTSINFAVLFHKPIIFITMDKIQKCNAGRLTTGINIESMAIALKKKPVNIDNTLQFNWSDELYVDLKAYETYQNDIIKKQGSPECPLWEIFAQSIRSIYN